jgi:hypothetical protein
VGAVFETKKRESKFFLERSVKYNHTERLVCMLKR